MHHLLQRARRARPRRINTHRTENLWSVDGLHDGHMQSQHFSLRNLLHHLPDLAVDTLSRACMTPRLLMSLYI